MKFFTIILFITFLLLPGVLAVSQSTVKDAWFPYYDTFTVGGDNYSIRGANTELGDEDNESIFVIIRKNSELGVHVFLGTCETTEEYEYCFLGRDFTHNYIDIDVNGNVQPAIHVKLTDFNYVNSASISRTFEATTLFWGEKTTVGITVENNGDFPLEYNLEEPIPEGYAIIGKDSGFIEAKNSTLTANFILFPGKTWTKEYEIQANTYESKSYKTKLTYKPAKKEDPGELKTTYAASKTITIKTPYKLTEKLAKTQLDVLDVQSITITITNTEDVDIRLNDIQVTVPPSMEYITTVGLRYDKQYTYIEDDLTIKAGESKSFTLNGRIPYVGEFPITYEGSIKGKTKTYPFSNTLTFTTSTEGIYCSIKTPALSDFESLKPFTAQVVVGNKDNERFYSINGTTNLGDNRFLESIAQDNEEIILEEEIIPPFSLTKTQETVSFNGTYLSNAGQEFNLYCENSFNIAPSDKIFDVELISNTTAVNINETVKFSILLNNAAIAVNPITITLDDQERATSIAPGEVIEEKFTTLIPEFYEEDVYVATATITTLEGYTTFANISFTVNNPYDFDADFEEQFGDSTTDNKDSGNKDEVTIKVKAGDQDTSFFGRLKTLIKSIFS